MLRVVFAVAAASVHAWSGGRKLGSLHHGTRPIVLRRAHPLRMSAAEDSDVDGEAQEKVSFGQRIKNINEGNKMKATKKEPPKVGPRRMPPEMIEVTQTFKKQPPHSKKSLEILWAALVKCYGTEELAKQAVLDNPQILNPSYTFCNTMLASKDVLFNMMSKEEALEVMTKNPAVLQCGPALANAQPDEVKSFATIRYVGNRLLPEAARLPVLGLVFLLLSYGVAYTNAPGGAGASAEATLGLIKPVLGAFFATLFGTTLYGVATASRAKPKG